MPLTAAKIGVRSCRNVCSVRSKSWRCRSQSALVMSLRWRRSLPTEKARSPAPVMTAARMLVSTAISSRTSVSRAPIAVVIALSACGRFSVMIATRPSGWRSRVTGDSGSSPPDGGGPKLRSVHRVVREEFVAMVLAFRCRSGVPIREPAQPSQARGEAVLAAAGDDERRHAGKAAPDRTPRDRERPRAVVRPGDWILLGRRADKDAVIEPLRLDELELTIDVRTDEHEDDAPAYAVVSE